MLTRGRLGAAGFEGEDGLCYNSDACLHHLAKFTYDFVLGLVAFAIPIPVAAQWRPELCNQAHPLISVDYGEALYETTKNVPVRIFRRWQWETSPT